MKFLLAFVFSFLFSLSLFSQDSTFVFKRQLGLSLESGFINTRGKTVGSNYGIGGWHEERFNGGFALVFNLAARYKVMEERSAALYEGKIADTVRIIRNYSVDRTGLRIAASVNAKIYYSNTKKLAIYMLIGLGVEQTFLQDNKNKYLVTRFQRIGAGGDFIDAIEENISPPERLTQDIGPELILSLGLGYKKTNLELGLIGGWTDWRRISFNYGFKLRRQITDFKKKTD